MKIKFALAIIMLSMSLGCGKSNQTADHQHITLTFNQTYCSDPWMNANNDSLTLINIATYLKSSGLYFESLDIKQDGNPEICLACQCKTGKTIFVRTLDDDIIKSMYLKMGFK